MKNLNVQEMPGEYESQVVLLIDNEGPDLAVYTEGADYFIVYTRQPFTDVIKSVKPILLPYWTPYFDNCGLSAFRIRATKAVLIEQLGKLFKCNVIWQK